MNQPLPPSGLGALELNRRAFLTRMGAASLGFSALDFLPARVLGGEGPEPRGMVLGFPGPWQFQVPKAAIILVNDQQLEDLQDPDKAVDLSVNRTPDLKTLRKVCEDAKSSGARTLILAFDEFWSQYRAGQGGKPRQLLPDTDEYIRKMARISETVKSYGLGFELSLLSPLEVGRGYREKTGESGRWVQYREGYRDPASGMYTVSLWEQRKWTNNKGTFELERTGIRVFAFRESRVGGTGLYAVNPADIVELKAAPEVEVDESSQPSTSARRLILRGRGVDEAKGMNRVLAVVSYRTPEMDYFSPRARPFLEEVVSKYHAANVPLNGLYADEMHIQQDWGYGNHHDEGQFTFRFLTENFQARFAELYGAEYKDFERYLVYFCYGQHGFYPDLEARLPAQHVLGRSPEEIQKTFLLRHRYYDLLQQTVVGLFAGAKGFAEKKYGHDLESRAHATWAQSPTCDFRFAGNSPVPPRQYEYTPDFLWSNTVQQSAAACSDYFAWNDFLTGGGNDHAEGGWSDRNYYGIALACSTGILNRVPYAYAAAWGMPGEMLGRHQAVCDAFGASANPWFQAVQDCQHRDIDVLMLYPLSLVACEERFGSWMTQYAYANYVSPRKFLEQAKVEGNGKLAMAGRTFGTLVVLFEPLPPPGLLAFIEQFLAAGGKVIWSGPPPRLDFQGQPVLAHWQKLFGIESLEFGVEGKRSGGREVRFSGRFSQVSPQVILTDFLVDLTYGVKAASGTEAIATLGRDTVGTLRGYQGNGSAVFLGFRPRDDQSASLGKESRTWFDVLSALGSYPASDSAQSLNDNPAVVSRTTPYVACRFPNGTTAISAHYCRCEEAWPGGFHRDENQDREIMARNPPPSSKLGLKDFRVNGYSVDYSGDLVMAFRLDDRRELIGFAGYNCQALRLNGRDHKFASSPMNLVAWSPVLEERRVAGGAVLEIWAQGEAELSIPLPQKVTSGTLYLQGARLGVTRAKVESVFAGGRLVFKSRKDWGQAHLYLLPV